MAFGNGSLRFFSRCEFSFRGARPEWKYVHPMWAFFGQPRHLVGQFASCLQYLQSPSWVTCALGLSVRLILVVYLGKRTRSGQRNRPRGKKQ